MSGRHSSSGVSEVGKAAGHRLDDARPLLSACRWRAAMYLAGYAVECRRKNRLMRTNDCDTRAELGDMLRRRGLVADPDAVFTHSLAALLKATERADALQANLPLWKQFDTANRRTPAWRYSADLGDPDEAADFVAAAAAVAGWVEHSV